MEKTIKIFSLLQIRRITLHGVFYYEIVLPSLKHFTRKAEGKIGQAFQLSRVFHASSHLVVWVFSLITSQIPVRFESGKTPCRVTGIHSSLTFASERSVQKH